MCGRRVSLGRRTSTYLNRVERVSKCCPWVMRFSWCKNIFVASVRISITLPCCTLSLWLRALSLSVGCAELSNNSSAVPRRYGKSFCRAIASDHFNPFGWKTTFEFITFFLFFKLEIEMRHHSLLDGGHFVSAPWNILSFTDMKHYSRGGPPLTARRCTGGGLPPTVKKNDNISTGPILSPAWEAVPVKKKDRKIQRGM